MKAFIEDSYLVAVGQIVSKPGEIGTIKQERIRSQRKYRSKIRKISIVTKEIDLDLDFYI